MSQASNLLKKIAASEEYKALAAAIESKDYETIAKSYLRLGELMQEEKKQVLEKILSLPRQNKDEDCQKFESALALRASSAVPQWYWLNQQLKEQGVIEGDVFGVGTRGDPLVRTPQGRVVVIAGATLERGTKIRFKVVSEGQKLDFGRLVELTPDYFSFLLNREVRDNMKKSFGAVEECLRGGPIAADNDGLSRLGELLKGLEETRALTNKLEATEREGTVSRIVLYRKRLMNDWAVKLAFDLMTASEDREIGETCRGDEQQLAKAMAAPGLLRYGTHLALKAQLFAGQELKGYSEILKRLEGSVVSMGAALRLMEFQSGMEKVLPSARAYLERMDRLFDRLNRKARQVAITMAEGNVCRPEDIRSTVSDAFSGASLSLELRRTFRNAEEFFALRGALTELRTMMGDAGSVAAELALRPYLSRKVTTAFEYSSEREVEPLHDSGPQPVRDTAPSKVA